MEGLVFLLDCSGSMNSKTEGLITAANALLSTLRETIPPGTPLTIFRFNQYLHKILKTTLGEFTAITYYESDGETALYDAVCTVIRRHDEHPTTFVIVSDGNDTASVAYTREEAASEIEFARAHQRCQVLFIGEGLDANTTGMSMGVRERDMFLTNDLGEALASAQFVESISQSLMSSPDVGIKRRDLKHGHE
jgi:uncharacterized protein with von Willebrand factor type A (vWA) domain